MVNVIAVYHQPWYVGMLRFMPWIIIATFLYMFYWIKKTTKLLNQYSKSKKRNEAKEEVMCLLVPFYFVYWCFNSEQVIYENDSSNDSRVGVTVLSIFPYVGWLLSILIIQVHINRMVKKVPVEKYAFKVDNSVLEDNSSKNKEEKVLNDNAINELRRYKSLLDEGIITQEEFDEKKSTVLK